jgi:hypothetical protein
MKISGTESLAFAVESIVNASDVQDALHQLTCVDEIQQFYLKTLKYRVEDEIPFYYKMLGFKAASKSEPLPVTPKKTELLLFINEMEKIVRGLYTSLRKGNRLFEVMGSLKAAVESDDLGMIEVNSSSLWDEDRTFQGGDHAFRNALAEDSGGDLYKVQEFEKFLLSVVRHQRWFNTLTQRPLSELGQIRKDDILGNPSKVESLWPKGGWYLKVDDSLGLEIVKKYLTPDSFVPLQFPWLSDFLLLMVFDGLHFEAKYSIEQEEPLVRFKTCKDMPLLINNLTLFRNEISARLYDTQELVRRLRQMDVECGYVIPSLVYPLVATQEQKPVSNA